MNVSSRTPKAMTNPISVRKTSGSTREDAEGPGEDDPGARDDPAGHRQAAEHPRPVPWRTTSSRTRAIRKML